MLISCFLSLYSVYLKNALALRGYTLKYLGVRGHSVCKLFSNGSEKNMYIHIERENLMNVVKC